MTLYSIDHSILDKKDFYKYAIAPFKAKDYLRWLFLLEDKVLEDKATIKNWPVFLESLNNGGVYALFGYEIAVSGGDPYDMIKPIAIASTFEEIQILVDTYGYEPTYIVNKL
jgi:hypothetical protein